MDFKRIILFIFTFLVFVTAKAYYSRLKLYQVIETTEIAFVGTIVNVDIECYTVEIERMLYGNYSAKTISIVKFADWQDHRRFKKYEIGQREIVFTRKSNNIGQPFEYVSIGAGNEGEIEIIGDSAIILDRISRETKYKLSDLLTAIVDYRNAKDEINLFYQNELKKYYEPFDEKILDTANFTCPIMAKLEIKSTPHKMLIDDKREKMNRSIRFYEYKYGCKELKFETDMFRYLFIGIDNRVEINVIGYNIDSIDIFSLNCKTTRNGNDFFVKPISGEKTDLYFVHKSNNKIDTIRSFDYYIEECVKPTVNIEIFKRLKESPIYPWGYLHVAYEGRYTFSSRFNKVISFSLDIVSAENTITLNSISSRITYEMMKNIRNSTETDIFKIYNIKAVDYKDDIFEIEPVEYDLVDKKKRE